MKNLYKKEVLFLFLRDLINKYRCLPSQVKLRLGKYFFVQRDLSLGL